MSGGSTPIDQLPISSNEENAPEPTERSTTEVPQRDPIVQPTRMEMPSQMSYQMDPYSGNYGGGNYSGNYGGPPDAMSYYGPKETANMTSIIMQEAKEPLIVAAVALLAQMGLLNGVVGKYVPGSFNDDGDVTMTGMLVKGLVAGVLFYVIRRFLR